jgi:hypothetical protein
VPFYLFLGFGTRAIMFSQINKAPYGPSIHIYDWATTFIPMTLNNKNTLWTCHITYIIKLLFHSHALKTIKYPLDLPYHQYKIDDYTNHSRKHKPISCHAIAIKMKSKNGGKETHSSKSHDVLHH